MGLKPRHPNSCWYLWDADHHIVVRCGWCNKDTDTNEFMVSHEDETSKARCHHCNKQLIYPEGAEW